MAATRPAAATAAAAPDIEQVVTDLARVLARLAIKSSVADGAASFGQILTYELKVATEAEAGRIEAWLTSHP